MTQFGDTLRSLLTVEGKTQEQLEAQSGVDRTIISRLIKGRSPNHDQLGRLCAAISFERSRRLELLLAHLRDEAAPGKLAGIDERHYVLRSAAEDSDAGVHLGADLELIAEECAHHSDVREIIADIAKMIMRHRAEMADVIPFSERIEMVAEDPTTPPAPPPVKKTGKTPTTGKPGATPPVSLPPGESTAG